MGLQETAKPVPRNPTPVEQYQLIPFLLRAKLVRQQFSPLWTDTVIPFKGGTPRDIKKLLPQSDVVEHSFDESPVASPMTRAEMITHCVNQVMHIGAFGADVQTRKGVLHIPSFQEVLRESVAIPTEFITIEDAAFTAMQVAHIGATLIHPDIALPLAVMLQRGGIAGSSLAAGNVKSLALFATEYAPYGEDTTRTSLALSDIAEHLPQFSEIIQRVSAAKIAGIDELTIRKQIIRELVQTDQKDDVDALYTAKSLVSLTYKITPDRIALLRNGLSQQLSEQDFVNTLRGLLVSKNTSEKDDGLALVQFLLDTTTVGFDNPTLFRASERRVTRNRTLSVSPNDMVEIRCAGEMLAKQLHHAGAAGSFALLQDELSGGRAILKEVTQYPMLLELNNLPITLEQELKLLSDSVALIVDAPESATFGDPRKIIQQLLIDSIPIREYIFSGYVPHPKSNPYSHFTYVTK